MKLRIFPRMEGGVVALFVLSILQFVTYFVYSHALNGLKEEIFEGLQRTTMVLRTLLDTEAHQQLTDRSQESTLLYQDQITPLKAAQASDSTLEFVYTMVQRDTTIYFILDPTDSTELDDTGAGLKSHIMDPYPGASFEVKECFRTQEITITEEVYEDQWGQHISCFVPILHNSEMVGVLGVDISAKTYQERLEPIKNAYRRTAITIFCIAYIAGLIMWFLRRFQHSLIKKVLAFTPEP